MKTGYFAAYDELKLLGYTPEQAAVMAYTYQPIGIYEQKRSFDNASHKRGKVPTIGLKQEFKMLAIVRLIMQMPFATAYTLLIKRGVSDKTADTAARLIETLPPQSPDKLMTLVNSFADVAKKFPDHEAAALELLQDAAKAGL